MLLLILILLVLFGFGGYWGGSRYAPGYGPGLYSGGTDKWKAL